MNRNTLREWVVSVEKKIASFFAQRQVDPSSSNRPDGSPVHFGNLSEVLFLVLGIIAFPSLILGILSFSRPAYRMSIENLEYEHGGFFSYSAKAPQGVYDLDTIKSGDPLFPILTCKVDFDFRYTLFAEKAENVMGTHQLTAIIAEPRSGWKRVLVLQPVTPFDKESFETSATVNLCEVEAIVRSFEENTLASPTSYELTISPQVSISGSIDGSEFQSVFDDGLKFIYDHTQFHVVGETENDPFKLVKSGSVGREREVANIFPIFGLDLPIPGLRLFSVIGLAVSSGGMAFLWRTLQSLSRNDQMEFINTKYGSVLVHVRNIEIGTSKSLVDVSSFDDLAKLAERYDVMVMHETRENSHVYYVQTETSTYRFSLDMTVHGQEEIREKEA